MKKHVEELKNMIKDLRDSKLSRAQVLASTDCHHNNEVLTKTFTAEYEDKFEFDERVKQLKRKEINKDYKLDPKLFLKPWQKMKPSYSR